jgi:hypothetical protein
LKNVQGFRHVLSHEQLQTPPHFILEFVVKKRHYHNSFGQDAILSLFPLGGATFLDAFVALAAPIPSLTTIYFDAKTSGFWKALTPANNDDRS